MQSNASDIFYAVARDLSHPFQVDAIDGNSDHARLHPRYTHTIRVAQGHGGRIQGQISDTAAHRRITQASQAPVCCHAARSGLVRDIIGLGSPGLLLGGLRLLGDDQGSRGHIHFCQAHPDGIPVFAGFRRSGVDVEV